MTTTRQPNPTLFRLSPTELDFEEDTQTTETELFENRQNGDRPQKTTNNKGSRAKSKGKSKLVKMGPVKGIRTIKTFLLRASIVKEQQELTHEEILSFIERSLDNEQFMKYLHAQENNKGKDVYLMTWEEYTEWFKNVFYRRMDPLEMCRLFRNINQDDKPVKDYYDEFMKCIKPDMDLSETEKLSLFRDGLNFSFNTVGINATTIEQVMAEIRTLPQGENTVHVFLPAQDNNLRCNQSRRKCTNCGRTNHLARYCRAPRRFSSPLNFRPTNPYHEQQSQYHDSIDWNCQNNWNQDSVYSNKRFEYNSQSDNYGERSQTKMIEAPSQQGNDEYLNNSDWNDQSGSAHKICNECF